MSFSVTLSPQGLHVAGHSRAIAPDTVLRPTSAAALLRHWTSTLTAIDPETTLGDVVSLLQGIVDIDVLSPLCVCDLGAFLAEADEPVDPATLTSDGMTHCEVYTICDLVGDASDGADETAYRAGPPYTVNRGFHGWGRWAEPYAGCYDAHPESRDMDGGFSLSFSKLNTLLHYPIRYNPVVEFYPDWEGPGAALPVPTFATTVTITLGEFLVAIFWEIGFHGDPPARDAVSARVCAAAEDARAHPEGLLSMDDVLSRLRARAGDPAHGTGAASERPEDFASEADSLRRQGKIDGRGTTCPGSAEM
jgi:hypothetical protein